MPSAEEEKEEEDEEEEAAEDAEEDALVEVETRERTGQGSFWVFAAHWLQRAPSAGVEERCSMGVLDAERRRWRRTVRDARIVLGEGVVGQGGGRRRRRSRTLRYGRQLIESAICGMCAHTCGVRDA